MGKKILSFLVCVVIALSSVSAGVTAFAESSNSSKMAKLNALTQKFPNGKYWNHVGSKKNNPDGYTSKPCTHHFTTGCNWIPDYCDCNCFDSAIQCMGYAYKTAYDLLGVSVRDTKWQTLDTLDVSTLCVGDVIRYTASGHSITVVGVKGDTIAYTGANWGGNCLIKWGTMDVSQIKDFQYVKHLTGNSWKNTDLTFFSGEEEPEIADTSGLEKWLCNADGGLRIRSGHSTVSESKGLIEKGIVFHVGEKYFDGTYLWGKVVFGSQTGWCALNYAKYMSGTYQALKFASLPAAEEGSAVKLGWNAVAGADRYKLEVSLAGKTVKTVTSGTNSVNFTFDKPGTYTLTVSAMNKLLSEKNLWTVKSKSVSLNVKEKEKPITSVAISAQNDTLYVGKSETLKAEFLPIDAHNDLVWKSSDTSVLQVDSFGTVIAVGVGEAEITCASAQNSKACSTVKITTDLAVPQSFKTTGYSSNSISLSWSAVYGADGYTVYKVSNDLSEVSFCTTDKTTCKDTSLKSSSEYSYIVRAFKKAGDKNVYSQRSRQIYAYTSPEKITGLVQTKALANGIKLSWNKVSGADGYRVYRRLSNGSDKLVADTQKNIILEEKLKSGTKYKYTVKAYHTSPAGYKKLSSACSFVTMTTAPAAVTGVKVSAGDGQYKISWKKTTGAVSYEVYRYDSKSKTYKKYKSLTGTSVTIKCKPSEVKTYKVRAVTKLNKITAYGAFSSKVSGFSKPGSVTVKAAGAKGSVKLTWNKNKYATGYEVFMLSGSKYKKVAEVNSKTLSYTVKKLKSGNTYTFKVRPVAKRLTTTANGSCAKVKAKAK